MTVFRIRIDFANRSVRSSTWHRRFLVNEKKLTNEVQFFQLILLFSPFDRGYRRVEGADVNTREATRRSKDEYSCGEKTCPAAVAVVVVVAVGSTRTPNLCAQVSESKYSV